MRKSGRARRAVAIGASAYLLGATTPSLSQETTVEQSKYRQCLGPEAIFERDSDAHTNASLRILLHLMNVYVTDLGEDGIFRPISIAEHDDEEITKHFDRFLHISLSNPRWWTSSDGVPVSRERATGQFCKRLRDCLLEGAQGNETRNNPGNDPATRAFAIRTCVNDGLKAYRWQVAELESVGLVPRHVQADERSVTYDDGCLASCLRDLPVPLRNESNRSIKDIRSRGVELACSCSPKSRPPNLCVAIKPGGDRDASTLLYSPRETDCESQYNDSTATWNRDGWIRQRFGKSVFAKVKLLSADGRPLGGRTMVVGDASSGTLLTLPLDSNGAVDESRLAHPLLLSQLMRVAVLPSGEGQTRLHRHVPVEPKIVDCRTKEYANNRNYDFLYDCELQLQLTELFAAGSGTAVTARALQEKLGSAIFVCDESCQALGASTLAEPAENLAGRSVTIGDRLLTRLGEELTAEDIVSLYCGSWTAPAREADAAGSDMGVGGAKPECAGLEIFATPPSMTRRPVIYVVFSHADGWSSEAEGWREGMFFGDVTLIEAYQDELGPGQEVLFEFYLSTPDEHDLDYIGSSVVVGGEGSHDTLISTGVSVNKMPDSIYAVIEDLEPRPSAFDEVATALDRIRGRITGPSDIDGLVVVSSRASNVGSGLQFLGDAPAILALSGGDPDSGGDFTVVRKVGPIELWFKDIATALHGWRARR